MRFRFFLACGLLGWTVAFAQVAEQAVHLRGTPALLPMAQTLAESYMREHPKANIVVSGGGTYRGYKSVLDGTADVAMVSSDPQDDVRQLLGPKSPTLRTITIGYTAALPVVHSKSPLQTLSVGQLRDIFSGRVTDWKAVGGAAAPVRVYVGLPTEGLTETWKQQVMGGDVHFTPQGQVMDVAARLRAVAADPSAITFVSHGDLRAGIKALAVNGVAATVESVQDSSYLLGVPLKLVTRDPPTAATQAFVQYFAVPNKRHRFDGVITAETRE